MQEDAITLLAEKLMTPLQIKHYLRLAFEEAHQVGVKPSTPEVIEAGLVTKALRLYADGYAAYTRSSTGSGTVA